MTDDTTPEDEGPITPEVVDGGDGTPPRRGAAARKRRVGADGPAPDDEPAPIPRPARGQATGRIFRMGCMLLIGIGVVEVFLGATRVADPDAARCEAARFDIDTANDDDDAFNDVDLPEGIDDTDDLECVDAIAAAAAIPTDEDETADGEFPGPSTFRTQGLILTGLGLAHGVAAFTLRTRARAARTAALVTAAAGIFLPILGFLSVAVMMFVVFALAFSADAKALFPRDPAQPSLFRPRPPASS